MIIFGSDDIAGRELSPPCVVVSQAVQQEHREKIVLHAETNNHAR